MCHKEITFTGDWCSSRLPVLSRAGTDLERGYVDVRPWRLPFHASPVVCKGPIASKSFSSQDPLLNRFRNFSLYTSIFAHILALKPRSLKIFSSQALKFGIFLVHKPPLSEANISSQAPHFGNPGRTPLPEKKKLSAPSEALLLWQSRCLWFSPMEEYLWKYQMY